MPSSKLTAFHVLVPAWPSKGSCTTIQERLTVNVSQRKPTIFFNRAALDYENLQAADKFIPVRYTAECRRQGRPDRRIQNLNSQSDSPRSIRPSNPGLRGRNQPNPFAALSIGKMLRAVLMSAESKKYLRRIPVFGRKYLWSCRQYVRWI